MNWFTNTLSTSIGKKLMMALTGFGFIGFLVAHLAGNLTIYGGRDAFNAYAEGLHVLDPLIKVLEVGLLLLAIVHVLTGTVLFFQNRSARHTRYQVDKGAGGRTFASLTMPYTGYLILAFVILHLLDFHFVDKTERSIFEIVQAAFNDPTHLAIYIFSMAVVAVHVSHGFWSAFQTLGANHPKYMPLFQTAGIFFSLIFGIGFGFIPIYVLFSA